MVHFVLRLVRRLRIEELVGVGFLLCLAVVWSLTAPDLEVRLGLTIKALLVLLAILALRLGFELVRSRPLGRKALASAVKAALLFGREWLPFPLIASAYENVVGLAGAICPNLHDSAFLAMDEALLGTHPSILFERLASPALTEAFAACYLSLYAYPLVSAALLYGLGRRRELREFMAVFAVVGYVGYACYLFVPVVGPGFAAPGNYSVALSVPGATPLYDLAEALSFNKEISIEPARNCFPSLHTAWGLVLLVLAFRHLRPLFYVYMVPISLMIVSTLYLRYHYVVDIAAGAVLALAAAHSIPRFVQMRRAQSNAGAFFSFSERGSPRWIFAITPKTSSRSALFFSRTALLTGGAGKALRPLPRRRAWAKRAFTRRSSRSSHRSIAARPGGA
ncbi:MAG: phosphatase PAP2 family protein [Myxococcota bacterium]|jgi:membrane-associated phospholipid phosphatase|nr:phosphatase PAP2 family protein [Myxococcota bacterium]